MVLCVVFAYFNGFIACSKKVVGLELLEHNQGFGTVPNFSVKTV
jgi:hypothetical protein